MGIDLMVHCNCWERGRCEPCPIDMSLLERPNKDCDFLRVKMELPLEEARSAYEQFGKWRATACEHPDGLAFYARLGSYGFVSLLEKDIEHLTEPAKRDQSVLLRTVNWVNIATGDTNNWVDCDFIVEDIDNLKKIDPADSFWAGTKIGAVEAALKCIRDGAEMSIAMQKNMRLG
jgi:hypothetical protein